MNDNHEILTAYHRVQRSSEENLFGQIPWVTGPEANRGKEDSLDDEDDNNTDKMLKESI